MKGSPVNCVRGFFHPSIVKRYAAVLMMLVALLTLFAVTGHAQNSKPDGILLQFDTVPNIVIVDVVSQRSTDRGVEAHITITNPLRSLYLGFQITGSGTIAPATEFTEIWHRIGLIPPNETLDFDVRFESNEQSFRVVSNILTIEALVFNGLEIIANNLPGIPSTEPRFLAETLTQIVGWEQRVSTLASNLDCFSAVLTFDDIRPCALATFEILDSKLFRDLAFDALQRAGLVTQRETIDRVLSLKTFIDKWINLGDGLVYVGLSVWRGQPANIYTLHPVTLDVENMPPWNPILDTPVGYDIAVQPQFSWHNRVADTTHFSFELAIDPDFSEPTYSQSNLRTTTFIPDFTLEPNSTYFWRVKGHNQAGSSSWSEAFIRTASIPGPTLLEPLGGDTSLQPSFSWLSVNQTIDYRLIVSANAFFVEPILDITSIRDTQVDTPFELPSNTTYHWVVVASYSDGTEGRSYGAFTTTQAEEPPTLVDQQPLSLEPGGAAIVFVEEPSNGYLNVREGAGTEHEVLTRLYYGDVVAITGGPATSSNYTWWRVRTASGAEGWAVESANGLQTLFPVEPSQSAIQTGILGHWQAFDPNNPFPYGYFRMRFLSDGAVHVEGQTSGGDGTYRVIDSNTLEITGTIYSEVGTANIEERFTIAVYGNIMVAIYDSYERPVIYQRSTTDIPQVDPTIAAPSSTQMGLSTEFDCATVTDVPPEECEALMALYSSTDGDNWLNNAGWGVSTSVANWHGVNLADGHVIAVLLQRNRLHGILPQELGTLSGLRGLLLNDNTLTGAIPPELANLANLVYLQLSSNQLTGGIPSQLGNLSNLQQLELASNRLTGNIPPQLENLSNLRRLDLLGNQLTGRIPLELGNLSSLESLYLGSNQLTGSIPPELGNLIYLQLLNLSDNRLTGNIPMELGTLTRLQWLFLNNNQLSGELPSWINNPPLVNLVDGVPLLLSENCGLWSNDPNQIDFIISESSSRWNTENYDCSLASAPSDQADTRADQGTDFACTSVTDVPPVECEALLDLYESTNGSNWRDDTGWASSKSVGEWWGITVSEGHVREITLSMNQLQGVLPRELGNLSHLHTVNLYGNQLSGSIPAGLGNLIELISLDLSENQLNGEIPSELGNLRSLDRLRLDNNQLTGSIPSELGNLANLSSLSLWINQLTGSIPPELGNLGSLEYLNLSGNQLTGSIPPELGNLSSLKSLSLGDNLTGSIPPELGNLGSLESLYLHSNQLTGSIPPELGNLSSLTDLGLSQNYLTGNIPPELGNLTNLTDLGLSYNQLTGSMPPELGNLTELTEIWLNNNQLTGNIPSELGNLSNLYTLNLSQNQLSGNIPPEIGNPRSNLHQLFLHENTLSGNIPPELGNLQNLMEINLSTNRLSGDIPPELGNLADLEYLQLWTNQLSGEIPPELGNLAKLELLKLNFNQLSGSIPPELGNLSQLHTLGLYGNQLSGTIPPELSNLTNLNSLDLYGNNLTGGIPEDLGGLTQLEMLNLTDNQLTGNIPAGLGSLTNLQKLYLAHNQLSGELPSWLNNPPLVGFDSPGARVWLASNCGLWSNDPSQIAFISGFDEEWNVENEDCSLASRSALEPVADNRFESPIEIIGAWEACENENITLTFGADGVASIDRVQISDGAAWYGTYHFVSSQQIVFDGHIFLGVSPLERDFEVLAELVGDRLLLEGEIPGYRCYLRSNAVTVDCPSRLSPVPQSGSTGRVLEGIGFSLNVRAHAARASSKVGQLDEGTIFTVIGGPNCNDSDAFTWWQVQTDSGLSGWVAEGDPTQNPSILFIESTGQHSTVASFCSGASNCSVTCSDGSFFEDACPANGTLASCQEWQSETCQNHGGIGSDSMIAADLIEWLAGNWYEPNLKLKLSISLDGSFTQVSTTGSETGQLVVTSSNRIVLDYDSPLSSVEYQIRDTQACNESEENECAAVDCYPYLYRGNPAMFNETSVLFYRMPEIDRTLIEHSRMLAGTWVNESSSTDEEYHFTYQNWYDMRAWNYSYGGVYELLEPGVLQLTPLEAGRGFTYDNPDWPERIAYTWGFMPCGTQNRIRIEFDPDGKHIYLTNSEETTRQTLVRQCTGAFNCSVTCANGEFFEAECPGDGTFSSCEAWQVEACRDRGGVKNTPSLIASINCGGSVCMAADVDGSLTGAPLREAKVIFINGINTSQNEHETSLMHVYETWGMPTSGIYNSTDGFELSGISLRDIGQSLDDWISSWDFINAFNARLWRAEWLDNPAVLSLIGALRNRMTEGEIDELEIVAHSQGAVITSAALRYLALQGYDLSNLTVTTLGGAGVNFPEGPTYHHYVICNDVVADKIPESLLAENRTFFRIPHVDAIEAHSLELYLSILDDFRANEGQTREVCRGMPGGGGGGGSW